jgi:uncharacterized RDD family membrane protein YckC
VPPTGEVPPLEPTQPPVAVPPGWPGRRPRLALRSPPLPPGYRLATLGARIVARLVDIGLVFLLNVLVNGWFVYLYWLEVSPPFAEFWNRLRAGEDDMSDLPPVGDQAGSLQFVILILAAALWFAYEVPAVANTGQTPGKRLLGIKVVRLEQAGPVGFGRSFRRWNTMGLPVLLWPCFGIGFVLQVVDVVFALVDRPLQQALHDKSSHTVVISVETSGQPRETPDDQQADTS